MSMYTDLLEFNKKFGLPIGKYPSELKSDIQEYRIKFMQEELNEYIDGVDKGSLHEQIDALVDLVYVAMGTAVMAGFNWDAHWKEVHRANMMKQRVNSVGESKRSHQLDCMKPKGWVPPRNLMIIEQTIQDHYNRTENVPTQEIEKPDLDLTEDGNG